MSRLANIIHFYTVFYSGSYILFKVSNKNEAKSLLSYMKCKLPNFILSVRKISQYINEASCKWIPLPPLNKDCNDEEVYKYFKLSEDEIKKYIEYLFL